MSDLNTQEVKWFFQVTSTIDLSGISPTFFEETNMAMYTIGTLEALAAFHQNGLLDFYRSEREDEILTHWFLTEKGIEFAKLGQI